MKCKEEGCNETAIGHRCAKHKRERELQKDREANARAAAKLRGKREAGLIPPRHREPRAYPPHPCADCGAEIGGRKLLCEECRKKHRAHSSKHAERVKEDTGIFAQVEQFQPWTPKPKPPPIMTEEEQRAINKAVDLARIEQSGLSVGKVEWRDVPREEWPEILPTIRPIHLIREKPLEPLTVIGGM